MRPGPRLARLTDRVFDRLRHRQAFALTENDAVAGDLAPLRGHTYAVVVTFRRNGEAVPSAVWFAVADNGRAYFKTADGVGKVKRIRNDSRVVIAPSSLRGRPVGPALKGTARILRDEETADAEQALAAAYGLGRRISERVLGAIDDDGVYVEVSPRGNSVQSGS